MGCMHICVFVVCARVHLAARSQYQHLLLLGPFFSCVPVNLCVYTRMLACVFASVWSPEFRWLQSSLVFETRSLTEGGAEWLVG